MSRKTVDVYYIGLDGENCYTFFQFDDVNLMSKFISGVPNWGFWKQNQITGEKYLIPTHRIIAVAIEDDPVSTYTMDFTRFEGGQGE